MRPVKRGRIAAISDALGALVRAGDDLALGVVGRGLLAPADAEAIFLGAFLHDRHGLGRLAEGDRQHAGGERIERAGVARLLGVEQEFEPPDRLGRGDADRLVEIDPAVDLDPGRALLLRPLAPRARRCLRSTGLVLRLGDHVASPSASSSPRPKVARHFRRTQKRVDPRLRVEARIDDEAQVGREFEIDLVRDQRAQFLLVPLQRVENRRRALAAERHHRDGRELEVGRHVHDRDRDRMTVERRIRHVAAGQRLGQRVADQFGDPFETMGGTMGFRGGAGHGLEPRAAARRWWSDDGVETG